MNKKVYGHLLRTYGRNPLQWLGLLGEIVRTVMMRIVTLWLMAKVVTNVSAGDVDAAKYNSLLFLAAFVIGAIGGTLGDLASMRAENETYRKLMLQFHRKLTGKDMSFYRDNQTGYLSGVFRQYVDGTIMAVRSLRRDVVRVIISLTIPAFVLLQANWKIGVIAFVIIALQILYIIWSSSKANTYRAMTHEATRKLTGEISDQITNIVAYKSSGMEDKASKKVDGLIEQEIRAFWLRRKMTTLFDSPRSIIVAIGITIAFYVVANGMSGSDPASAGLISLTLMYLFQISRNVSELPDVITQQDDFVTQIYPTLRYLSDDHERIRDPAQPKKLTIKEGAIDIDHVTFAYPSGGKNDQPIQALRDLSLHIAGGERIGIVGLSGAGKSTLASLIMRFDEVSAGSISIDGTDIRDVAQNDLHSNIAYVPQEPLLFHRTIRENIAYFNRDATDEDVIRAAKAAHAHDFISEIPEGYDAIVGERGIKLSGGQKQRVVIARAVLKKAPIMIFDEATSALDSESEQIIQRALPTIIGDQTAIVIAHRLSTIAGLDRIIVMHRGSIIEEGTHNELLAHGGRYHSLWQKQTSSLS